MNDSKSAQNVKSKCEELKAALPGYDTLTTLKKIGQEWHGACPICREGDDRFRLIANGRWACRHCDKTGDIVDLHSAITGLSTAELIKKYLPGNSKPSSLTKKNKPFKPGERENVPSLPGLTIEEWNKKSASKDLVLKLLCDKRKISEMVVEQLISDNQIKTGEYTANKRYPKKPVVAFPYADISDTTINATQFLRPDNSRFFKNADGKDIKKLFKTGSKPGSDCFFMVGADVQDPRADLIISESVINAITAHECFPYACSIALGGSTYTKKLKSLKPHILGRKVIVCQDKDTAGDKMVTAVRTALGDTVHEISFNTEDKTGTDINDFFLAGQKERVTKAINDAELVSSKVMAQADREAEQKEKETVSWDYAKEAYPLAGFPWHVLPVKIADSLKQLSRSCATSPLSIPGAAISIFSSTIGSTISVSPKASWKEPLIFWFGDVRPSGSGKTPAARALCEFIHEKQNKADAVQKELKDAELLKEKNDQKPVPRARGYYITNLTLEGIREDLSGHGGTVCVFDELSSFLSGQNQYKSGGTDREATLCLWDGNDSRNVRASGAKTDKGARVNLFGGIQPVIFKQFFQDKNGTYLVDGTIFRFLLTYENDKFFELTDESWSEENQLAWELTLEHSLTWADEHLAEHGLKPRVLILDKEAQSFLFAWRNEKVRAARKLPEQLRGFIPKMISYSLRLAGILYCFDCFARGINQPASVINAEFIQKGIDLAEFYLGHAVTAAFALTNDITQVLPEQTEQEKILISVLEKLRPEVFNGKLAIGFILEHFNKAAPKENQFKSAKAMGAFIRNLGLTIPAGNFRANGKISAKCLLWDKKIETLLDKVNKVNKVNKHSNHAGLQALTLKKQCQQSQQDLKFSCNDVDIVDIEKTKSTAAKLSPARNVDLVDIVDIVSTDKNKNVLPDGVRIEGNTFLI